METNKINYITIQQYLDGTLNKEAMHELEKQALDDPFLADAIEGYSAVNKPATKQLSILQSQLQNRIAQLQDDKNRFNFSWTRLSIAAAAGLLFVTSSILFWIKTGNNNEQLAKQAKQVEVNLTPADSVNAIISGKDNESGKPLSVQLNKDNTSPNEVVVGNSDRKGLKEHPEPAIGWTKYQEYLKNNIALSGKRPSGEIIVTFNVGTDKQLSNFKIEKGLDDLSNQEAIRVIKTGPVWNTGKNTFARVIVQVY